MAGQQSPNAGFVKANRPAKGKTSSLVSDSYNKSGVALTGPGGSGTASVKDIPTKYGKAIAEPGRVAKLNPNTALIEPGSSGKDISGTRKVGSGDTTRYVDVPEANKDRGKTTPAPKPSAKGEYAGESRTAPLASKLASASKGNTSAKDDSATATDNSGGKMTLNDFMRIAANSGKSNAYRRGYQMFKNYQKTGKLPSRRVGPDK